MKIASASMPFANCAGLKEKIVVDVFFCQYLFQLASGLPEENSYNSFFGKLSVIDAAILSPYFKYPNKPMLAYKMIVMTMD